MDKNIKDQIEECGAFNYGQITRYIIDELKEHGKINRDFEIGMRIQSIDDGLAGYYDLNDTKGVIVTKVYRNSPADKGGIEVGDIITEINDKVGISVECSLGFLTVEQAKKLKELKVKRYNHNLETAKSKFSEICTTHTYEDRLKTLGIARDAGLELCTGGIIGLGETREQRLELTLELARLYPEEVTINILVPVPGTPLELQADLPNSEIIRMFSVIRFLLPESVIKISGGRETNLDDSGEELLQSGANGIITAGYLTMDGNEAEKDRKMIEKIGLQA